MHGENLQASFSTKSASPIALPINRQLNSQQTGKHAIQGLLRSSRKILHERDGIRVNAVCPGVTDTPMTAHILDAFKAAHLYWQPPEAVANTIVGIQADSGIWGKAYYIEGGDSWEIEDSVVEFQPQWLSEEGTRRMRVNSEAVQKVSWA